MLRIVRKPQVEVEQLEETKEESKMKNVFKGMSLKKKLLIGAGVVATVVGGVFAYGQLKPEDEVELEDREADEAEDGEFDDYDNEDIDREAELLENYEKAEKETEE